MRSNTNNIRIFVTEDQLRSFDRSQATSVRLALVNFRDDLSRLHLVRCTFVQKQKLIEAQKTCYTVTKKIVTSQSVGDDASRCGEPGAVMIASVRQVSATLPLKVARSFLLPPIPLLPSLPRMCTDVHSGVGTARRIREQFVTTARRGLKYRGNHIYSRLRHLPTLNTCRYEK